MIFIITGTQEPFDRLIRAVDEIAAICKTIQFIAQISKSELVTHNLQTFDFISPVDFNKYIDEADLIIGHAGTGTIFSAMERDKPIIVMPRLAKYGEHRNDHQLATCQAFERLGFINIAYDEIELKAKVMESLINKPRSLHKMGRYASNELIESLQEFIGFREISSYINLQNIVKRIFNLKPKAKLYLTIICDLVESYSN